MSEDATVRQWVKSVLQEAGIATPDRPTVFSGKWIRIVDEGVPSGLKTHIYSVETLTDDILGTVKWFGRWRCYAFFPCEQTVYEGDCLGDITTFLRKLKDERRRK